MPIQNVRMTYKMPRIAIREDLRHLYPNGASTLQLIIDGHRTATTRSKAAAPVASIVTFEDHFKLYVITNAYPLKNMPGGFSWEKWSRLECWDSEYILSNDKLRKQCNIETAWQTTFRLATIFDIPEKGSKEDQYDMLPI